MGSGLRFDPSAAVWQLNEKLYARYTHASRVA